MKSDFEVRFKQLTAAQVGPFNDDSATFYLIGLDPNGEVWFYDSVNEVWKPLSMRGVSNQARL